VAEALLGHELPYGRFLRISDFSYREFGNFERVFNAGPRDLEYLPGNNMRERVVAIVETERAQSFVVCGSEPLNFIRPQGGVLDELVNSHSLASTRGGFNRGYRNLAGSRKNLELSTECWISCHLARPPRCFTGSLMK
jgi:hypothetical protein